MDSIGSDRNSRAEIDDIYLSIIVPVYNERDVLKEFNRRLASALSDTQHKYEVLYVDDGSIDETDEVLLSIQREDPRVIVINLSRNFGKEAALAAGLDHAQGLAVINIDADLQDPPEIIPDFVELWQNGYDMVYGQRISRAGDNWLKKITASGFYRLIRKVSQTTIPADAGDFRLISRNAVDALKQLRESSRFTKGLYSWVGFKQIAVPYARNRRYAGQTKWNYIALWRLSIDGITSFTVAPLKFATYTGVTCSVCSLSYGAYVLYKAFKYGDPVHGWPSLMVVITFLGGAQLMTLGIIGEYLSRVFIESKNRPLYIVSHCRRHAEDADGSRAKSKTKSPARE